MTCCFGGLAKIVENVKGDTLLERKGALLLLPNNAGKKPEVKYSIDAGNVGEGAYGIVKRAVAKGVVSKEVALKLIRKDAIKNLDLFKNEVEINAAMDHPNIVKLFETFEDNVHVYCVLEICHGGEVFDAIVEHTETHGNTGFSEADTSMMMVQILHAVFYMHSKDVVHRDLKTENLLFLEKNVAPRENSIKVIDFGIAKRFQRTADGSEAEPMKTKAGTAYYVAPEVIRGSYNEKCDVWSCGSILFVLLSGQAPFDGDKDDDIFKNILHGRMCLDIPQFKSVSRGALDLLNQMTQKNPKNRLSAEDCLHHRWVQEPQLQISKGGSGLHRDMITRLQHFTSKSRFKKAAMHVIAHNLDDVKIKELRETFMRIDTNGDGQLSLAEMQAGFKESGVADVAEMVELFKNMDTDDSGNISYTEFLTGLLNRAQFQDEAACREAFRVFDQDGNGSISMDEMAQMLEENKEIKTQMVSGQAEYSNDVMKMFRDTDVNGDGQISFDEFMGMMRQSSGQSDGMARTVTP